MAGDETSQTQSQSRPQRSNRGGSRGRRGGRGGRGRAQGNASTSNSREDAAPVSEDPSPASTTNTSQRQGQRSRRGGPRRGGRGSANPTIPAHGGPSTRRTFGGHLTSQADIDADDDSQSVAAPLFLSGDAPEFVPGQAASVRSRPAPKMKPKEKVELPRSTAADLGTRIHEDISTANYECIICTEDVLRNSKVYSCTKCYTVLHLKCVQAWYKPQIAKRGEEGDPTTFDGSWRCPGCNSMVQDVPSYHCWCGKEDSPKPANRALPPHSCGQTCAKPRPTCPHPCPLQCHAGPCPPCDAMGPTQSCFCGKHENRKPCRETDYSNGWSCEEICGDLLPCGTHTCDTPCHPGLCGDCFLVVDAKCYCGRSEKMMACYQQGDIEQSYSVADNSWFEGSFSCDQICARKYDCGIHQCHQDCHTQDELPGHCPFAPDVVSHCPCGKTPLGDLMPQPRQTCEEPILHCQKPCDKLLNCGHLCKAECHEGDCPSCNESINIPCRCGRTHSESLCHQGDLQNPWCLRTCQANLNCGRHKCGEHCCTGEKKAAERLAAQKRKKGPVPQCEPEHICIRTCGKLLKCGQHNCEQMCHRGLCGSCPEAIFEEISCNCGKTVLQPPQPCGTRPPECRFQCPKQPSCGHPAVDHHCHPGDVDCPKCPFLVDRPCVCGKETISYHPCHLQEARCGKPCGEKLECGHICRKSCHRPGECSGQDSPSKTCGQVCAKPKSLCSHPCQSYCHGRSLCDESLPCPAKLTVACPCGQRKKEVKCLSSTANPSPSHPRVECDDECLRLERNRRLAEALNINPTSELTDHVPYSDLTLELYTKLGSWAEDKEREFRVFAAAKEELRMRFAPMPSVRRQFLHVLAQDFRLESYSEDREPHRHVVVAKQMLFVSAPSKTLGQCVKIKDKQAAEKAAKTAAAKLPDELIEVTPFNALLLTSAAFGITIDDVKTALNPVFATQKFTIHNVEFLHGDEILIRVTAAYSASVAPSGLEALLDKFKEPILEVVKDKNIAGGVLLANADPEDRIMRRERPNRPDPTGWNAVAGRAAKKDGSWTPEPAPAPSGRMKLGLRKKPAAEKSAEKAWGVLDGDVEC